jgi:hypothetical protein
MAGWASVWAVVVAAAFVVAFVGCGADVYYHNHYSDYSNIIEGRVTGWDVVGEKPEPGLYWTVAVHVSPVRAFKGEELGPFDIVDSRSLAWEEGGPEQRWIGYACGDCNSSSFISDPTGQYIVVGLQRDGASFAQETIFYTGPEPNGYNAQYDRAINTVERLRVESIADQYQFYPWIGALLVAVLVLLIPGFLLRIRRERREAGRTVRENAPG